MQVAMMPGQSPSSTLNGNASTPDPPVPTSDGDRLRASMEAWKRSAAVASERYGEARQRQIAAERDDRQELRKRWLEEEAKKRAENVGKHKDGMSNNLTSSMPPPLYQSTPINNRDNRKRHLDTNDYGHEEWRQGFRMMEGCGMPDMSKTSTDMYPNMSYPPAGAGFYPGMMMPGMRQQSVKNVGPGFSPAPFPNNGAYPAGSFPPNNSLPNAANGQFPSSKSTPSFQGSSFSAPNTAPSTMSCSSMPSTSTADSILSQRFPSMELPQFPVSSDSTPTLPQPPQQTQFSGSDSTSYNCGMRPSPSMCPTSPNEVPTPPALASSGSVQVGSSCPNSTAVVEQNLRSPAEDLGCNAVNEDNMTRMLTSIRTDSLGMLGADAVDSLFDSDTNGESGAGQVPVVTSTDNTSSPAGFSHGGPQSVHSVHSAPQSNGNCNPPSTPTAAATTPSAPHSTSYSQQVSAPQSTSFPQASPSQSSAFPQPSPSQQTGYPQPAAHGQPSPFTQNSQSQATFFAQPSSSQSTNFPATSVGQTTSFPIAPSSQTAGFATAPAQSSAFPPQNVMQQNAFPQQMQTGGGFQQQAPMPTSNPYPAAPGVGVMGPCPDPSFMAQQNMMNPGFGMNGYPGYDMSQAQMNQQQQFAMQAQQQQQMAMGVGGAGAAMSAQQYHMVMMQKHQQHMKAMMQQRAALMYQNYPNGAAAMSQQQYFMHMQKMQQTRFANGVDPSASAFMGSQRVMGMRGGPVAPGSMMEPMAPTGGYPGYAQGMQSFAAQQQYVGQFSMN